MFFNRIKSKIRYKLAYRQQWQCCSGYGPLPNCPRKLFLIDILNITIIFKYMVHQFSYLQFLMWYKYGMLSS